MKIININQCSASALRYIVINYGFHLISDLDIAQDFITAALNDASQWQEPGPGAGYDIIVLGGELADGTTNRQSWMVNLQTGETAEKACIPREIQASVLPATCSTAKGALLAGGGSQLENKLKNPKTQCIFYNKTDNMWALLPEFPSAVKLASAVCMDVRIYVIGGWADTMKKMDCLDMTTMTWSSCPDLLQGQVLPVVGLVGQCIFVVFSTHPNNELTTQGLTLQCLDTWTILTPPQWPHIVGAAMYLKGRIIICGGHDDSKVQTDIIESYDPAADTWQTLSVKLPKPLWFHCIIPA